MQAMKGVDDVVKKCSASGGSSEQELLKATAELRKLLTPPTGADAQPGIVDKMIVHAARVSWDKVWLLIKYPLRMVCCCIFMRLRFTRAQYSCIACMLLFIAHM